jgi:hypothetical protein
MVARRPALALSMVAATMAGLVGVCVLLVRSMRPSARARAEAEIVLPIERLRPGRLLVVEAEDRPIYLFRPTPEQWRDLRRLDAHVWDRSLAAYDADIDAFVYVGLDTARGCRLMEIPPGASVLVRHAPEESSSVWLGGYVGDWCLRNSYDYAGRAIRSRPYTYNGYDLHSPNLTPVAIVRSGERYVARRTE